jgi:hypothetical protein
LQVLGIRGWRRQDGDREDGGPFWGRPGPIRGCGAMEGWMDGCMDTSQRRTAPHYKHNKVLSLQTSAVAVFAPKHSDSYQRHRHILQKPTVKQINSITFAERDSVTRSRPWRLLVQTLCYQQHLASQIQI